MSSSLLLRRLPPRARLPLTPTTRPPTLSHTLRRYASTGPGESVDKQGKEGFKKWVVTPAKYAAFGAGSIVFGLTAFVGILFIHDAMTYKSQHIDRVPVSPLALNPERGGPKNLPVAQEFMEDQEDEDARKIADKPRLVIIGGGWGAVATLQHVNYGDYKVTLISPQNHTLFTPLLPSAAVGTVEIRSLVEPLRKLLARVRGHFVLGEAVDVDMAQRLVEVKSPLPDGKFEHFYIPYDKVVIAVGSNTSTHGVPGLEHCFQLKTVGDVQRIRKRIMCNLEAAALPTTSEDERRRLLSYVVCGGGPTGVEMASEIYDLLNEEILRYFPKLLRTEIGVHIIQSRDHILNTYAEQISEYAEKKFAREDIDVLLNARVARVEPDRIFYTVKDGEGKKIERELPAGFVLWSTGIAMNPLARKICERLPNQFHSKAIVVDSHLRVKGAPLGTVYAVGDDATIDTNLLDDLLDLVEECDTNNDGRIDMEEFELMSKKIRRRYPLAVQHFEQIKDIFKQYDTDKDNVLNLNELARLFQEISGKITALPATAQVASQEGKYLGKKLSTLAKQRTTFEQNNVDVPDDDMYYKPFTYQHLGSLAYIGNSAVLDFPGGYSLAGGLISLYLWRSVYWSEQVSMRTRALLMIDWIKRGIWGRDLSKF